MRDFIIEIMHFYFLKLVYPTKKAEQMNAQLSNLIDLLFPLQALHPTLLSLLDPT